MNEEILRNLEDVKTIYKDKYVYTGEVNIYEMVSDVIRNIKELHQQLQSYKDKEEMQKGYTLVNLKKGELHILLAKALVREDKLREYIDTAYFIQDIADKDEKFYFKDEFLTKGLLQILNEGKTMNKCMNSCDEKPIAKVRFDNKQEWEYVCSDCFLQMVIEQLESRFYFEYEYIGKVKKLVRKGK